MFTELHNFSAWKKAMKLADNLVDIADSLPGKEWDAAGTQLRRSALSVVLNIAEGFGRYSFPEKRQKYVIARGELYEAYTALQYCKNRNYVSVDQIQIQSENCDEMRKILNALIA